MKFGIHLSHNSNNFSFPSCPSCPSFPFYSLVLFLLLIFWFSVYYYSWNIKSEITLKKVFCLFFCFVSFAFSFPSFWWWPNQQFLPMNKFYLIFFGLWIKDNYTKYTKRSSDIKYIYLVLFILFRQKWIFRQSQKKKQTKIQN